jgi:hypothetical protein
MKPEMIKKIKEEEDYVYCPKLDNSLKKVLNKNPDGLEDSKIAGLLGIDIQEVERIYQSAVKKIRQKLNIKVD